MTLDFSPALAIAIFAAILPFHGGKAPAAEPKISEEEVKKAVFSLTDEYLRQFQHPETGVLYGARLSGKDRWTSPEDVLAEKPKPWGYGSRIADTVLHTGHLLVAFLDAYEAGARQAKPDPHLETQIRKLANALRLIGELPESHPKPGKLALEGLVPRGPHPDNFAAYFDDSSMDQHTTYIISLAIFARSSLASEADRKWIRESLGKVGRRLEKHGWSIMRADGETQAHVGFSWKGFNSSHASILLPAVLALYQGTGDEHWRETYEHFLSENEGKRWAEVHPGPQIRINGNPIYANQNAFRVHAWHQLEESTERKKVIGGLLKQSTEMQLERDFPGEFYRKYHSAEIWRDLEERYDWGDGELRGAAIAWEKFQPAMLEEREAGLCALAHVRFPLGGFHMVLLSGQPELIREHIPAIWKMLNSVELEKVDAGETHYLFTVVALHLYANYLRHPEWFASSEKQYGPELDIIHDAGTGPVMDVAIEGGHAYAIGREKLRILDIADPSKPAISGELDDLGSVRQIVVQDGVAYITSRQDGLFVVDVRDPSKPELFNHFDTIEFATGVAISGDILFVACRHYGVQLISVANPAEPRHISAVRTGEAQSVVAKNGYLYVGVWATSEVVTVDCKNPWKPVVVSKVPLDGYGDGLDVEGDLLLVATGHHSQERPRKNPGDPGFGKGHGLEAFDLTNPANPAFLSRVKFPPLYEIGNDMWGVTIANGHAFVADTYNGLFVLDVSNPSNMKFTGRTSLPFVEERKQPGFVGGLAVDKDVIFLAGGYTDLHVVSAPNVATPPTPEKDSPPALKVLPTQLEANSKERSYVPGTQVYGVAFPSDQESLAVVACGNGGIHLIEFAPEIRLLSQTDSQGFATDVSVSGQTVFVAESAGGLGIYQISQENKLVSLGRFAVPKRAIRQVEVSLDGQHAMIQVGANQFVILDVQDPAEPRQVLKDTRHGLLYGDQMMRGLVHDRYTCVFWHVTGLHWYDLKADPTPAFSENNYPERIGSSNGLIAFQDKTLATIRGGYRLLDRSATIGGPDAILIEGLKSRHHLGVPSIAGNRLYTANRAYGVISVIDISNPLKPVIEKEIPSSGNPSRIAVKNGIAFVPNGYEGLLLLESK